MKGTTDARNQTLTFDRLFVVLPLKNYRKRVCQRVFLQRGTETVFYHFAHSLIVPCHKTGKDYNSRLDLKVIDLTAYQHQNRLYPLEIAYGDGAKGKSNLTHFC